MSLFNPIAKAQSCDTAPGNLRNGPAGARSTGPRVTNLQNSLIELGFDPGPVDGIFGGRTEAAVKLFQQSKALAADGIVGPLTQAALCAALSSTPPPTPPSPPAPPTPKNESSETGVGQLVGDSEFVNAEESKEGLLAEVTEDKEPDNRGIPDVPAFEKAKDQANSQTPSPEVIART